MHSLILRYAKASFLFKSAKLISKTRPFNPSDAIFVPCVFVMRVRPQSLTAKMDGAVSLYHSFFKKGSTAFLRLPFLLFVSLLFLPCVFKTLGFETQSQGPGKIMLSVFLAAAIKNRRTKPVHKPVLPTHILVLSRRQTKLLCSSTYHSHGCCQLCLLSSGVASSGGCTRLVGKQWTLPRRPHETWLGRSLILFSNSKSSTKSS